MTKPSLKSTVKQTKVSAAKKTSAKSVAKTVVTEKQKTIPSGKKAPIKVVNTKQAKEIKKPRGRKPTGKALSSTERGKVHDEAIRASGGRILSRVRLDADAAKALDVISGKMGSDRLAIETSLVSYAKTIKK